VSKNALDNIDKIAILFLNIKQHTRRFAIKLRLMFSKEHYIVLRTYMYTTQLLACKRSYVKVFESVNEQ
jgi:hypothetical protein